MELQTGRFTTAYRLAGMTHHHLPIWSGPRVENCEASHRFRVYFLIYDA